MGIGDYVWKQGDSWEGTFQYFCASYTESQAKSTEN